MVKLPISDYVSNYYKEQGIAFTLRQQVHICWQYNDLLKDQINSIREILEISDDEKLNTEIRERIAYEEKAYERFIEGQEGCIYIVHPHAKAEESYEVYFATAKKAISYGVCHIKQAFVVAKIWLFDKNPKWLSEEADYGDSKGGNETLSWYRFTSEGNIIYGESWEYKESFDIEDCNRFENMYFHRYSSGVRKGNILWQRISFHII